MPCRHDAGTAYVGNLPIFCADVSASASWGVPIAGTVPALCRHSGIGVQVVANPARVRGKMRNFFKGNEHLHALVPARCRAGNLPAFLAFGIGTAPASNLCRLPA